jgi:hypothetical protein
VKRPATALLLSLWFLYPVELLSAGEKEQPGVELKIGVIFASNQNDEFDPKLARMKNQLEVIKYRSYRLMKEESQRAPWRTSASFEIPGGRLLTISPEGRQQQSIALSVRLVQGDQPLLDTKIRLRDRGNILVGGPAHDSGVLILSISAKTP